MFHDTKEYIKNHKEYLKIINKNIKLVIEKPQVYLFGSIIEGNLVAARDIDILIIADIPKNHLKRAEIIANIEEKSGLPLSHPFEFHLLTQEEFDTWNEIYKIKIEDISSYI
ncbi:MAG TPA: nucleotidyltransferase domain-containing protein [Candidatus Nanopelagicaceae bacterium]|nr:nucleotidyltransferase domain-containing protein [Candidatus Nanopelagicaceae bacterium]